MATPTPVSTAKAPQRSIFSFFAKSSNPPIAISTTSLLENKTQHTPSILDLEQIKPVDVIAAAEVNVIDAKASLVTPAAKSPGPAAKAKKVPAAKKVPGEKKKTTATKPSAKGNKKAVTEVVTAPVEVVDLSSNASNLCAEDSLAMDKSAMEDKDTRNETDSFCLSETSEAFDLTEDNNIERLISAMTPNAETMREPELSNFYISPTSNTGSRLEFADVESISKAINMDAFADLTANEKAEEAVVPMDVSADNNETAGNKRKRKPQSFFDPTPPSRAKKSPAKAVVELAEEAAVEEFAGDAMESMAVDYFKSEEPTEGVVTSNVDNSANAESTEAAASAKKKRTPKPRKLTDNAATEEVVPAPAPAAPVLAPELQVKVDKIVERINLFANELVALEKSADIYDTGLELDNVPEIFIKHVQDICKAPTPSATTIEASSEIVQSEEVPVAVVDAAAPAMPAVLESDETKCHNFIKLLIARTCQGSSATLSTLLTSIQATLAQAKSALAAHTFEDTVTTSMKEMMLNYVDKASDAVSLAEDIKLVAKRESQGYRLKNSNAFEDDSLAAVWRWECFSTMHFSSTVQGIIKEAKVVRGRYSRAIKAMVKVIEQIQKQPYDESKLPPLEERVSKCIAEIEKAKEKRREIEMKKEKDAEERAKREELKEKKRKEKEEADLQKKLELEAAAQAKAAAQAEKERKTNESKEKQAAVLGKQQNFLKSFFVAPKEGDKEAPSTSSATPSKKVAVEGSDEDRLDKFLQAINSNMSMQDILAHHRRSSANSNQRKSTKPRKIRLNVMVSVSSSGKRSTSNAFQEDEEDYCEIKERTVGNRWKTLSFHEDHRPAYVGTFSKTSRVINGRNPLGKDRELFNYDYDSEEEWEEEEEEGEDIMESGDEEEEEEGNELVYDDFFRQDNDFGSDVDDDGDGIATFNTFNRVKEDITGPRFLHHPALKMLATAVDHSSTPGKYSPEQIIHFDKISAQGFKMSADLRVISAGKDDEVDKLSAYTAVVFAPQQLHLNTTTALVEKVSKKEGSAKKEKKEVVAEKEKVVAKESTEAVEAAVPGESKVAVMKGFDETKLADLIRFIHGKKDGLDRILILFSGENPHIAKAQIKKRIIEIADKAKHTEGYGTQRWIVKSELLAQHCPELASTEITFTPMKAKKRVAPTSVVPTSSSAETASTAVNSSSGASPTAATTSTEKAVDVSKDLLSPKKKMKIESSPCKITNFIVARKTSPASTSSTSQQPANTVSQDQCTSLYFDEQQ